LALQVLAESPVQGVKVNVFDGGLVPGAVGPILPRSALGLAHACPIGGLVSGAPKAVALHKGFQQIKAMAILGLPVTAKPSGNPTQNVAGQTRHPRPRHDQQTRVVGDELKVLGPRRAIPAEAAVARGTLPSGGAKEHASQRTPPGVTDQILQVLALMRFWT